MKRRWIKMRLSRWQRLAREAFRLCQEANSNIDACQTYSWNTEEQLKFWKYESEYWYIRHLSLCNKVAHCLKLLNQ